MIAVLFSMSVWLIHLDLDELLFFLLELLEGDFVDHGQPCQIEFAVGNEV